MRHTPGPWHRNIKPAAKYPVIFAGRNTYIAIIQSQGLTPEEVEGNCDLVTAAPALLEALKEAVEQTERNFAEVPESWRAAIEKAVPS